LSLAEKKTHSSFDEVLFLLSIPHFRSCFSLHSSFCLSSLASHFLLSFSFQVSMSPTFYEQLFRKKVFFKAFLYLQFGIVFSWRKNIGSKTARKTLVKSTRVAWDPLPPISCRLLHHPGLCECGVRGWGILSERGLCLLVGGLAKSACVCVCVKRDCCCICMCLRM